MMPGPMLPMLGSAGKGVECGAGGCPVLQESVCMGEAESVTGGLLQGAGVFWFDKTL